jgi:hypothetical protein
MTSPSRLAFSSATTSPNPVPVSFAAASMEGY